MANAHHEHAQTRHSLLKTRTKAFCAAFLDLPSNPPQKLLQEHFTPTQPCITEHGPSWASSCLPFLGRTFTGVNECLQYFDLLSKTLEFIPSPDTFGDEGSIVVDENARPGDGDAGAGGLASVKGKAKFKAIATGKEWEEEFVYRLSGFDEDGKIGHWEVWADPLSAWVAVGGEEEK
ncbi:hypothetical protein PRZ48_001922 [Zasmidium cellare]|uniref:Uncharacterized protein n=1 Tax=Zasmidium cellare TaxID=395010 RepID=A0ABR0F3L7_ZASCE|nr:hypothetical protein PRZ48_001922 [Zasmidium cellare]